MTIEVAGIYENGVLRLDHALPLADQSRVTVTVNMPTKPEPSAVNLTQQTAGMLPWKGTHEELQQFLGDELSVLESR